MPTRTNESERFRVEGNRLVVTSNFDPRVQREAEGEFLTTFQGMLETENESTLYLDLYSRRSFPSMLIGIIVEAQRLAANAKKALHLRVHPDHVQTLQWVGFSRLFKENGLHTDAEGLEYVEYVGLDG